MSNCGWTKVKTFLIWVIYHYYFYLQVLVPSYDIDDTWPLQSRRRTSPTNPPKEGENNKICYFSRRQNAGNHKR